ncbi:MAG: ABC transporter permease [Eubacteriales bacterium]|nr:ABC transporter permease [Bacillota bacterium]MBV1735747.1 ABC transporter permease [Desulforudis sp.]MDP3049786.1 ABC transporter permease [Eubacteriales bacterium]MDP3045569.1 ABC transporter permease [Bacillota bacterium]MDZ4043865.1 ABC transporter permease [Eubacteriales bacterium]
MRPEERVQIAAVLVFIARKSFRLGTLLVAVCVLSFWLVSHSPIDPVNAYVGADVMRVGPEQRAAIAAYWGLNDPPLQRLVNWGAAVLRGDWGTSMIFRQPVIDVISERFTASLALMGTAWVLSGVFGFALGIIAGARQGTWIDRCIKWYCLTLASTPTFWLGLLLLIVFAVWLGWAPVGLGVPAGVLSDEVTFGDRIRHLVLPAATLSILGVANVALHTRQKLVDVLASDYVLFARAKGESEFAILWKHGLRNVALPAVTLQFASLSELFGGSILAEQVFAYPGLGQATVQAGLRGDVPLLLGAVIFGAVFVFVGNLLADIIYRFVDPRIRWGGRYEQC